MKIFRCIALLIATASAVASSLPAAAQLSLAPTFVFVDSSERVGSVVVTNGSTQVQEVIIDYRFGYPTADSLGRRFIQYDDSLAAERYDLSGWIRSYPQRFRVEPGRRQVVRLLIQPPHDLDDGVYWTRMTITSTEPSAATASGSAGTSARIDFQVKQIIPVVYRKGRSTTGVHVAKLFVEPGTRGTDLRAIVNRDGEEPFFGSMDLKLSDTSGRAVTEISTSTEVYFTSATHFRLEADEVPPGRYDAEVVLRPQRRDVPARQLPAMEPVSRRFTITIPAPAPPVADAK